jgi:hypothetical protein
MANVSPAAVMVPVRGELAVLAATLKLTVPLPDPFEPLVIVIQLADAVAVQAQPLPLLTLNAPELPAAGAEWLEDESEYVQGAAACVTVIVWPPAVMVPVRGDVAGFAATVKLTVPGPEPLVPLVIVIQAAEVVADQAHPLAAFTPTEPVLKPDGAVWAEADSE